MPTVTDSHRTAITATYRGPTNSRGSRIRVHRSDSKYNDDPKRLTVEWNPALNSSENYTSAISAYVDLAGWDWADGNWVIGGGSDTVFAVWAGRDS